MAWEKGMENSEFLGNPSPKPTDGSELESSYIAPPDLLLTWLELRSDSHDVAPARQALAAIQLVDRQRRMVDERVRLPGASSLAEEVVPCSQHDSLDLTGVVPAVVQQRAVGSFSLHPLDGVDVEAVGAGGSHACLDEVELQAWLRARAGLDAELFHEGPGTTTLKAPDWREKNPSMTTELAEALRKAPTAPEKVVRRENGEDGGVGGWI
eukprot:752252-Hanusia_phi.AAC.1